jgi:hypothetical protein
MKGFTEFIGESREDDFSNLPALSKLNDLAIWKRNAAPHRRVTEEWDSLMRWFIGSLKVESLGQVVEVTPSHPMFRDMINLYSTHRGSVEFREFAGKKFGYALEPDFIFQFTEGDLYGDDMPIAFWANSDSNPSLLGADAIINKLLGEF